MASPTPLRSIFAICAGSLTPLGSATRFAPCAAWATSSRPDHVSQRPLAADDRDRRRPHRYPGRYARDLEARPGGDTAVRPGRRPGPGLGAGGGACGLARLVGGPAALAGDRGLVLPGATRGRLLGGHTRH